MYRRILVPLDGSELAEQALDHAVALARAFGAELCLVRVVPVAALEIARAGAIVDIDAEVADAQEYLQSVAQRIEDEGVPTNYEVRRGDVTEEILAHAEDRECDLIVISTHGRSGIARWVYGSIADRVLRYGLQAVPAILVVAPRREEK